MTCSNCQTVAQKRDAFETAKHGLPQEVVTRVMKGLFIPSGDKHDAAARTFLQAWAAYRPHYQLAH